MAKLELFTFVLLLAIASIEIDADIFENGVIGGSFDPDEFMAFGGDNTDDSYPKFAMKKASSDAFERDSNDVPSVFKSQIIVGGSQGRKKGRPKRKGRRKFKEGNNQFKQDWFK